MGSVLSCLLRVVTERRSSRFQVYGIGIRHHSNWNGVVVDQNSISMKEKIVKTEVDSVAIAFNLFWSYLNDIKSLH